MHQFDEFIAPQDGSTPAYHAAVEAQFEVLELLRDAGADLNKADNVCT